MKEDVMVAWHHQLNGHEFKQTPGDGEGQDKKVVIYEPGCQPSPDTESSSIGLARFQNCEKQMRFV